MSQIGVVVRKDGTVPFDEDVPPHVRDTVLKHLADRGHTVEPVAGTRHYRIKNWTPAKAV